MSSKVEDKGIEDKVKKITADKLGLEVEKIDSKASFTEDLGADSLDTVELVIAFEEEFHTEISDEDAEQITTVQAAIDYIQKRLQEEKKEEAS